MLRPLGIFRTPLVLSSLLQFHDIYYYFCELLCFCVPCSYCSSPSSSMDASSVSILSLSLNLSRCCAFRYVTQKWLLDRERKSIPYIKGKVWLQNCTENTRRILLLYSESRYTQCWRTEIDLFRSFAISSKLDWVGTSLSRSLIHGQGSSSDKSSSPSLSTSLRALLSLSLSLQSSFRFFPASRFIWSSAHYYASHLAPL